MKSLNEIYASLGRFRALYVLATLELCVIVGFSLYSGEGTMYYDTKSYYRAYDVIMTGRLDEMRTPLYPLLIGVCRSIFGVVGSTFVVYAVQSVLFLFSIRWLGAIIDTLISNRRIAYLFTAIYALYPPTLSFCAMLMSESITISLVTAVLYLVGKAFYRNSFRSAALAGVICLLLWLQRPSMIILTFILLAFWCLLLLVDRKRWRRVSLWGVSTVVLSVAAMGVYAMAFGKEYGKPGLSVVTSHNIYVSLCYGAIMDGDAIESPEIKHTMDSILKAENNFKWCTYMRWAESDELQRRFGYKEFDKFVIDQIKAHPKEWLWYISHQRLERLLSDCCAYTGGNMKPHISALTRLLWVNNSIVLTMFVIGLIFLVCHDIRQRRLSLYLWLLFTIFAADYAIILVGAPNDFARLLAQNYPLLMLVMGWTIERLVIWFTSDDPQKVERKENLISA